MREIKCKAWYRGTMYDRVNLYIEPDHTRVEIVRDHGGNIHTDTIKAKILWYTGLKDRNGTPILEGDILEECLYIAWCDKHKLYAPHMSSYTEKNKCMQCTGDVHWYDVVEDNQIEVLGNIYEHSHLLDDNEQND